MAFLNSFTARESAVATLGSICQQGRSDAAPEAAMALDGANTPVHAASLLLFMILPPPCIAVRAAGESPAAKSDPWVIFFVDKS